MVKILVESQSHNARPSLELDFQEVFFRKDFIFPADILIVAVVRLDGNYFAIPDVRFDHALIVTAAVAAAGSVDGFLW